MHSFPDLEPVCCSMSSSNRCFLTCIQISQESGQVVWYSHLLKNVPQFALIHTVKGFGIVHKAEVNVFLELSCFFHDPADVGNLISGFSAYLKPACPFICWWTSRLFPCPGYYKQCCDEHCGTYTQWSITQPLKRIYLNQFWWDGWNWSQFLLLLLFNI